MRISVLYFAGAREIAGEERDELELAEGATLDELRAQLVARHALLGELPFVFAVNEQYADAGRILADGDVVALVPAISGGAPDAEDGGAREAPRLYFDFTHETIDARPLEEACRRDADGAIVTFWGVTRDHHEGDAVATLAYEAYEPMARSKMQELLEELGQHEGVGRIHCVHRLGEVPIGEASICVVVSAPHRGPAFEIARELMDRLKKEIPIFKKERLAEDGGERWVGTCHSPESAHRAGPWIEQEENAPYASAIVRAFQHLGDGPCARPRAAGPAGADPR
jgi:molybdopterin converting factor subunit 1